MASKKLILTLACVTALAVLAVGCGSDDDDSTITTPVVDTAPPAITDGLEVAYSRHHHAVLVSWQPNVTDADFAGFMLTRSIDSGAPVELFEAPRNVTEYWDLDLVANVNSVTYQVYSVDASGNASAPSSVVAEVPQVQGIERGEF